MIQLKLKKYGCTYLYTRFTKHCRLQILQRLHSDSHIIFKLFIRKLRVSCSCPYATRQFFTFAAILQMLIMNNALVDGTAFHGMKYFSFTGITAAAHISITITCTAIRTADTHF